MALVFSECCFCIDLRTGCLIIGYLNLIAAIEKILESIVGLAMAGVLATHGKDTQTVGAIMLAVIAIMLVGFILYLAFTIVLLVGLHQYKRGHVKAYLIFMLTFLVVNTIMFFASFAGEINPVAIVIYVISTPLSIYFLLVIRSYYLKMDDSTNKPAVYNTA